MRESLPREHPGHRRGARLEVAIRRVRGWIESAAAVAGEADIDQAVRVGDAVRPAEEQGIGHAEDGDVAADADGQRGDDDRCQRRTAAAEAQRVSGVAPRILEPRDRARVAMAVADRGGAAETEPGFAAGVGLGPAAAPILVLEERGVGRKLALQVGVRARGAEERGAAPQQASQEGDHEGSVTPMD